MKKHIVFDCDGTLVDTSSFKYVLYDGIKELLLDLSTDCVLYVWTARGRQSCLKILKDLDILQYFDSISTPDDGFAKPHPEGIERLVGAYSKQSICMIGDTNNDILGAKNFGVMSLGATWASQTDAESLIEMGADFIVKGPAECSKLIRLNLKEN